MLTVDDYGAIPRAHRDGMSIHQIARTFHHSRYRVREILHQAEPVPGPQTRDRPAPVLGPLHAVIDRILAAGKVPGKSPVLAVLSGGNVDPLLLSKLIDHGLSAAGRYLVLRSRLPDRPG